MTVIQSPAGPTFHSVVFAGCRGWLHAADGRLGVVICGSHGFDELCAHRGLTVLADRLATAGLPTLRFDLPGTGDSAGTDLDDGLVDAWLGALRESIEVLRRESGCERVALVGLRLGALLATRVAQTDDVDLLCALAPPPSARAYARELRVMARLMEADGYDPGPGAVPEGAVVVCGFVTTAGTATSMLDLDRAVDQDAGRSRGEMLVLLPDDAVSSPRLPDLLAATDWPVEMQRFPGYAELMCEPTASVVPTDAWDAVVRWLAARQGHGPTSAGRGPRRNGGQDDLVAPDWCENGVNLASPRRLVGILCRPSGDEPPGRLVLIGNAGGTHHIGWARQTVELARFLARHGIASLRFDSPGTGASEDNPSRRGSPFYTKDGGQDISAVLDFAEHRGYTECSGLGICSGAYQLFHAARRDGRLRRLVLVNLQCFEWTSRFRVDLKSWQLTRSYILAERRMGEGTAGGAETPWWLALARHGGRTAVRIGSAAVPSRPTARQCREVDAALTDIAGGGCETLLVYSEDDAGLIELEDHFGPMGKRAVADRRARVAIVQDADHTLTQVSARRTLQQLVLGFVDAVRDEEPEPAPAGRVLHLMTSHWKPGAERVLQDHA